MKYKHIMLEGVSTSTYNRLMKNAMLKSYTKGEIVHYNTELCSDIDFLIKGSLEVEHLNEDGSRLIVRIFKPNDVIGINVTFSSNPYYIMNFVARENLTLLRIRKEVILEEMSQDKVLMSNILRNLSDNSLTIGSRIKNEFRVTIRNQLVTYLLSLYEKQSKNPVIIPISKTELAEHFGVSRTSISRELAKMEKEELLSVKGKIILLKQIIVLKKL